MIKDHSHLTAEDLRAMELLKDQEELEKLREIAHQPITGVFARPYIRLAEILLIPVCIVIGSMLFDSGGIVRNQGFFMGAVFGGLFLITIRQFALNRRLNAVVRLLDKKSAI